MRTVITSNFESEDQIRQAMETYGQKPEESATPVETKDDKPAETPAESGQAAEPAKAEAAAGETAPVSEPGDKPKQETQEKPTKEKEVTRGWFKSRLQKAEDAVTKAQDSLAEERGSKAALERRLEEAQRELAALKPPEKKEDVPVRPKRPTLAEFEFDQEKFDTAMNEYEAKLDDYHGTMAKKHAADLIAEAETKRKESVRAEAAQATEREHIEKIQKGVKDFGLDDYGDMLAALPETDVKLPAGVEGAIQDSEHPALLTHYFMRDYLENDGAEIQRLFGMNPVAQIKACDLIEKRLIAEHTKPAEPVAEPVKPAAAAKPPEKPPVKPKIPAKSEEPITPVGSRAGASAVTLANAGGLQEYMRLRKDGVTH